MTKQEFINKYIYGIGNDALTDNQEAIDMSNDLDKYVTEQLQQYDVSGQGERLSNAVTAKDVLPSEWKLIGHSHQIADTGDYDGHYEITNGKTSLLTRDDDDESLQPIVDALNDSGCKFYQDDWPEFENKTLKDENAGLRERVEELEAQNKRLKIAHYAIVRAYEEYGPLASVSTKQVSENVLKEIGFDPSKETL